MRHSNLHSTALVVLTHSEFPAFPTTLRRDSRTISSGSRRQSQRGHLWVHLLTTCREDMREQVFDGIVDTIVMKVQRQIDESRRIAKDHDREPDLDIEVCAALIIPRLLLSFKQAIILAGGLSQNPYLKSKMRGHF